MIQLLLPDVNRTTCISEDMFPGLDPYYTDPAQHILTGEEVDDDLGHDLSEVCKNVMSAASATL